MLGEDGLTDKQRRFVAEYTLDYNATRAAERAGYKGNDVTLAAVGYENLRKPQIATAIAEYEANLADNIGITKRKLLETQWKVIESAKDDGQFAPANKGLETLMRHRGMLTDRQEIESTSTVYTMDIGELDEDDDGDTD